MRVELLHAYPPEGKKPSHPPKASCLGVRISALVTYLLLYGYMGWGIRRALGLGSCGRDGRAYLIDPPQYLATSEFLRRWAASTSRRVRRLLALRQVCMFGGVSIPPKNPWNSSTFSYRDSAESEPYPLILNRGLWQNARGRRRVGWARRAGWVVRAVHFSIFR